jgi:SAM-dependent methyltransferase
VTKGDYRLSHMNSEKGCRYDTHYDNNTWAAFTWLREKAVLRQVLAEDFGTLPGAYLDFACGTGRVAAFLEERVGESFGLDISQPMLSEARAKLQRTTLVCGDITRHSQLLRRDFELITAFRFFANAQPTLRLQVARALRSLMTHTGLLVFNNHHHLGAPYMRFQRFKNTLKTDSPYRTMSLKDMHILAENAGLRIVALYPVGFAHLPLLSPPPSVLTWAENLCLVHSRLYPLAEDLVAVCRPII